MSSVELSRSQSVDTQMNIGARGKVVALAIFCERKRLLSGPLRWIQLQGRSCNHKSTLVQDQGLLLFISYQRECLYENIYPCYVQLARSNGDPFCKRLAALLAD